MIDGVAVIRARKAGDVRYCLANESSGLSGVLTNSG
jgi:hypothetical protein